jgi:hypothetical protein
MAAAAHLFEERFDRLPGNLHEALLLFIVSHEEYAVLVFEKRDERAAQLEFQALNAGWSIAFRCVSE